MSYVSAFILYKGIKYCLFVPLFKAAIFIIVCYISIIADVMLFYSSLYFYITVKNGLLTILATGSFFYARSREGESQHGG